MPLPFFGGDGEDEDMACTRFGLVKPTIGRLDLSKMGLTEDSILLYFILYFIDVLNIILSLSVRENTAHIIACIIITVNGITICVDVL